MRIKRFKQKKAFSSKKIPDVFVTIYTFGCKTRYRNGWALVEMRKWQVRDLDWNAVSTVSYGPKCINTKFSDYRLELIETLMSPLVKMGYRGWHLFHSVKCEGLLRTSCQNCR